MKIRDGFVVREVAGQSIVVALGDATKVFNGMIKLNDSALFIWNLLENDTTEEKMIDAMLEEYEIDRSKAALEIQRITGVLKDAKILEEV